MPKVQRRGLTLIELLVVMVMIGILAALLLPAIQKVHQASTRSACADRLRQIGLALHDYHDDYAVLPPGLDSGDSPPGSNVYWYWSWVARILPYVGEDDLWQQADDYARTVTNNPWAGNLPGEPMGNPGLRTPLPTWRCPADRRELLAYVAAKGGEFWVAFTDYQGVSGLHAWPRGQQRNNEGILFDMSQVRFADITDGLSDTVMVGERPMSPDLVWGWWFAGSGQTPYNTGSPDVILGVQEENIQIGRGHCPQGPYRFGPGDINNPCDIYHYWSLHSGGANFLFADASVHFLAYTIDPAILPALATRAGNDYVDVPPGIADR